MWSIHELIVTINRKLATVNVYCLAPVDGLYKHRVAACIATCPGVCRGLKGRATVPLSSSSRWGSTRKIESRLLGFKTFPNDFTCFLSFTTVPLRQWDLLKETETGQPYATYRVSSNVSTWLQWNLVWHSWELGRWHSIEDSRVYHHCEQQCNCFIAVWLVSINFPRRRFNCVFNHEASLACFNPALCMERWNSTDKKWFPRFRILLSGSRGAERVNVVINWIYISNSLIFYNINCSFLLHFRWVAKAWLPPLPIDLAGGFSSEYIPEIQIIILINISSLINGILSKGLDFPWIFDGPIL